MGTHDLLNPRLEDTVQSVFIITCSTCSVIGACIIIFSFVLVRSVRTASKCIVVVMAVADIMVALPGLMSELIRLTNNKSLTTSELCKVQSLFMTVGAQVSMIWTAGLAQHMYILVACSKSSVKVGFAVLIAMSIAVVAENVYLYNVDILGGSKDVVGINWCWIKITKESTTENRKTNCNWMLYDGKILEIAMYAAVFVYYFLLYTKVKHLKARDDFASSSLITVISRTGKIIAIPFVFVLVRLWGTLVTLWLVSNNCNRPQNNHLFESLLLLMSFFDMSQGWVNFILYFLTTRQEFRLVDKLKLVIRSIPYLTKTRRPHCSENSYLTYNESGGGHNSTLPTITNSSTRGGSCRTYSCTPVVNNQGLRQTHSVEL